MAGQRYSRILEAAKLYSAVDNYIKYITDSSKRGAKVGQGTARKKSISVFVRPFGIDLPASTIARQTSAEAAFNSYASNLSGSVANTAGSDTVLKLEGFRAARLVVTTGRSPNGVPETSKVTGLKYLKYGGSSTSLAFGKKASGTDTQATIFEAARSAILGAGAVGTVVSLQEEKI